MVTRQDLNVRRAATAVALLSVAAVAVSLLVLFGRPVLERIGFASKPSRFHVGRPIGLPETLYRGQRRTLLIFSKASCSACQTAKPILSRLAHNLGLRPEARALLVTDSTDPDERRFAEELGIAPDGLAALSTDVLRGQHVPAVALVDRNGVVLYYNEDLLAVGEPALQAQLAAAFGMN